MAIEFRRRTLLPLDDVLSCPQRPSMAPGVEDEPAEPVAYRVRL